MIFDVAIIGAGPAGSVLAYRLSQQGINVLLVEKEKLPRYKICGGGLSVKTIREIPFDIQSVIDIDAEGGEVTYAKKNYVDVTFNRPISSLVMRDRFDSFLTEKAQQAGARLVEETPVHSIEKGPSFHTIISPDNEFKTRIVVGADGVNSLVARSFGLIRGRRMGSAIEAEIRVPQKTLDFQGANAIFDFGAVPYGYGWIFPKRDHLSIGVFCAHPKKVVSLKSHLNVFIENHSHLIDHEMISLRGHRIPLGGEYNQLHQDRALLVGDAANLADPFLGEGIYYSIRSANIAADVILDFVGEKVFDFSVYTNQIHQEIIPQLRHSGYLASLVYHLPRFGCWMIGRSTFIQDSVYGVVRGDLNFRELNWGLFFNLPKIIYQLTLSPSNTRERRINSGTSKALEDK